MGEVNGAIKPRLSVMYDRSAPLLSRRGQQIVDRAIKKGAVGGDAVMQLLFAPTMLPSLDAEPAPHIDCAEGCEIREITTLGAAEAG
jgi:hypothetical protein